MMLPRWRSNPISLRDGIHPHLLARAGPVLDHERLAAPPWRSHLPFILVVNPALPINSVADLIKYAKENPGKLSFGSGGVGASHHLYANVQEPDRRADDARALPRNGART
jgi:hypothetical protein